VNVQLNRRATREEILAVAADEVVIATGCRYCEPAIPGSDLPHVVPGAAVAELIAAEVERRGGRPAMRERSGARRPRRAPRLAPGRAVTVIGNDLVALETAEFMARSGRIVTVITTGKQFGQGLPLVRRWRVLANLRALAVALLPQVRDIVIARTVLSYVNPQSQRRTLRADTVLILEGAAADPTLSDALSAEGLKVHVAGDCGGVGYLQGAMHSAARLAVQI
jgi:2,4-dienoyl-CoA reductase (NADPH2)